VTCPLLGAAEPHSFSILVGRSKQRASAIFIQVGSIRVPEEQYISFSNLLFHGQRFAEGIVLGRREIAEMIVLQVILQNYLYVGKARIAIRPRIQLDPADFPNGGTPRFARQSFPRPMRLMSPYRVE